MTPISNASAGTKNEVESNDTATRATRTYDDYDNYGYISSSGDVDWWCVSFSQNGWANYWMGSIPSGKNYNLYLYASDGTTLLESSTTSGNGQELIRYDVVAGVMYRIKIVSTSGYSTSNSYFFRAKWYSTESAKFFTFNTTGSFFATDELKANALNTTATGTTCAPILWDMGYDAGNYINNTANSAYNALPSTDITVMHYHGSPGAMYFANNGEQMRLYAQVNADMGSKDRALSQLNLSNVKLIVFAGCQTGQSDSVYGNLVDTAIDQGASFAIGWDEIIYTNTTKDFLQKMFEECSQGETVEDALYSAYDYVSSNYEDLYADPMLTWYCGDSDYDLVIG